MNTKRKAMLGVSMLLVSSCIIAQEPAKSKTPMYTPTKQASSPTQESAKPGSENKNNAVIFKGAGKNQTSRDANKTSRDGVEKGGNGGKGETGNGGKGETGNGGAGKGKATTKSTTQRDRPKDIPN